MKKSIPRKPFVPVTALGLFLLACPWAVAQESELPADLQRQIDQKIREAGVRQRQAEVERLLADLEASDDFGDHTVLMAALRTLGLSAEEGVPVYLELLDGSEVAQQTALMELGIYGPEARAAGPEVLAKLRDPEGSAHVRAEAALTLGKIKSGPHETVPALMEFLNQSGLNRKSQKMAIQSLGLLGSSASEALSLLERYLESSDSVVQFEAYRSMGAIIEQARPDASALANLAAFVQTSSDRGFAAFQAIREEGRGAVFLTPTLIELFRQNQRVYIKAMAIHTLGAMAAGGAETAAALIESIASGDPLLSELGQEALLQISTADLSAVDVLSEALGHPEQNIRFRAARALKRFGAAAQPAVDRAIGALREADGRVNHHQIGAYLDILRLAGPDAGPAARTTIVENLPAGSKIYENRRMLHVVHLRAYMLVTLAEIGVPPAAMPHVIDNLKSGKPHTFAAAARAAAQLGPDAGEAVSFLMAAFEPGFADRPIAFEDGFGALFAFKGPYTSPRLEAIRAFAAIGPGARAAIPLLSSLADLEHDPSSLTPPLHLEAQNALLAIRGN